MPHRRTLALVPTVALALGGLSAAPAAAQPPGLIPTVSKIRTNGIGAFKTGMTRKQARTAAGTVYYVPSRVGGCTYWDFGPPGTGQGPTLRFHSGRLRYVEVARKQFKTKRGVEVGDRVRKVRRKYHGLHRRTDIGGGYDLVWQVHRGRLIFAIAGGRVRRIAGGIAPWALQQECE
jgi:hypothetical protein